MLRIDMVAILHWLWLRNATVTAAAHLPQHPSNYPCQPYVAATPQLLQGRALSELRSLEETSASLVSAIQEGTLAKRQLLDDLIEAERQIMLSERKIQLEKEMQVCTRSQRCAGCPRLAVSCCVRRRVGGSAGV